MKKILRVFPRRTSYTPIDDMVIVNEPPGLFIPEHDEIHISVVFTWDKERAEQLKFWWEAVTDKPVLIGGPAYDSPSDDFTPGLYVKKGVVFTSRGCNNNCPWCLVPKREGKLKELPITPGNIIQDNNFLQCSRAHKDKVFEMLRTQKGIRFLGGLEADLIDDHFIDNVKRLKVSEFWLACDKDSDIAALNRACMLLYGAKYNRNNIYAYALLRGKDMDADEARLRAIYDGRAMPFAQLYKGVDRKEKYSIEWRKFQRAWSRPAAIKAHMERGTSWRDY
jgi:hypothetical protein